MPVTQMVEARLAAGETDGWRYADMPEDGQAWRDTLGYLDADARDRCGTAFAEAAEAGPPPPDPGRPGPQRRGLARAARRARVEPVDQVRLHGPLRAPGAWAEIGFPGPAYPRGYKNIGVDKLRAVRGARRRPVRSTRCGRGLMRSRYREVRARNESAWLLPNDGTPDQPPAPPGHAAVRRRRRDRPGHRGLRRGRLGPAAAAGPGGLAGGRARRRAVLGPGRRLGQRRGRLPPPVLDRAAGDRGHRPGAAGLQQLRARRRRLHGPLRRLHAPLPPERLHDRHAGRRRRRLADRATPSCARTTRPSRPNCRWPGEHWPWGDPHGYPHRPHPVGGNGEIFLRGARKLGITAKVGPVAIPNGRFGNRPHCIYRGFCLQGCKVNAKASPLITHIPDALAHGAEVRAGRHGDPRRDRRAHRPGHRRALRPRRPGAVPAGPDGRRGRVLHRDAPAAAQLRLPALPRRPVQRLRPGRPLPHGAGRAADGGPLRRRDPDVQGAAARGEHRGVLRDRPGRGATSAGSPSRPSRRCRSPGPSTSPPRGTGAARCAST